MKNIAFSAAVLCIGLASAAKADLVVDATITATQNGSAYDYTIVLNNASASTSDVGTFWFAWVPGKDFLKTSPLSVTTPAGWGFEITHFPDVPTNGYAILWAAGNPDTPDPSAALAPGASLTFGFSSMDTPAEVFGESFFFPGTSVLTSFVYGGGPFQGASLEFEVTAVPEPSSLALAAFAAAGVLVGGRRFAGPARGRAPKKI